MAILEIGINLNNQNLINIQYYPSLIEHEEIKNDELAELRNGLITALDQFSKIVQVGELYS